MNLPTVKIHLRGLVQGVGFRPFIYLLANEINIKGEVSNQNDGVIILAQMTETTQNIFLARLLHELPKAAFIHRIDIQCIDSHEIFADFSIQQSRNASEDITLVSPDIAVCDACLDDRETQSHRINYPFVNCTHCGPRFSIIKDLPYDRERTTMSVFPMCEACQKEYADIRDRRFHAQPVSCNHCGPFYYATYEGEEICDYSYLLSLSTKLLSENKVIAAKGIGGYHLIADATSDVAVEKLRSIKIRDAKPFAVMFRDYAAVMEYADVNSYEKKELCSWRRPIVLLKQKKALAAAINSGMKTLGCMLPYMPIHYDWFEQLTIPALVMTSGNISGLPIAITSDEAGKQFGGKVDLILHHNRKIYNRLDDSVLQLCGEQSCLIRRSRGYVPTPFFTDDKVDGILAFGAEKTNSFALGKNQKVIQSQYIGDLKNWETFSFYKESMKRFCRLFRFVPKFLACDTHPDYLSTQEAERMANEMNLPLYKIQHHHAHAAACMFEYGLYEPVIAIVWDGTGLGEDGKSWGGEFFLCDRKQFSRLSHFEYVPMPGGDKVTDEPWRMAVSYLHYYAISFPDEFVRRVGEEKIDGIINLIENQKTIPETSSAGRLFDALSSLLGVCDSANYQGEAAVLLEQYAADNCSEFYPYLSTTDDFISLKWLFECVTDDLEKAVPVEKIAAKIHTTLALLIFEQTKMYLKQTQTKQVVISGGCFQNKRLTELLMKLFEAENIPLFVPSRIPCNDAGIAVGQLVVAAEIDLD